jgi:hypothetical protein
MLDIYFEIVYYFLRSKIPSLNLVEGLKKSWAKKWFKSNRSLKTE